MLPCWLNWPASLVALVSIRGTWLISAANLHISGCSTLTLLCFTLENNSTSNENTHFFFLWKCYRHEWECLLSFHNHIEQKQEHWERSAIVWNHGQAWLSMWAKSPSLLSHHKGRKVGDSRCFGDFGVSTSDGCDAAREREAASCGWLEHELQWAKGRFSLLGVSPKSLVE